MQAELTKAWRAGKIIACLIWVMHLGDHAKPNVLNTRGAVCFSVFLHYTAVWIASVQYLLWSTSLVILPVSVALCVSVCLALCILSFIHQSFDKPV